MKVHKTPLKTRPIVSCSGSLLHALGVWVDDKLQIAARRQRSYFKSSLDLKKELTALNVPPNAYLFTADAVSMYTNIPTDRALLFIGKYLRRTHFPGIPTEALMDALRLVMKNNIFTFGDTTWRQLTGTAMGTPPAPPWATLYFALNEDRFLPQFGDNLLLYRRFIDDVLGIWLIGDNDSNATQWARFQAEVNCPMFKLRWDFSPLSKTIDFMDLTLSIADGRIKTSLYKKPSNIHLYIPPHSCHPPGLLPGVVHGMVFRIFNLCSDPADMELRMVAFFRHLQRRGYQPNALRPLFQAAITRAKAYGDHPSDQGAKRRKLRTSLFFHLRYHPLNPPSQTIQRIWRSTISTPPFSRPLAEIKNHDGHPIGIDRMIVAYNRPLNLGNILSYRKLRNYNGPPISSFSD